MLEGIDVGDLPKGAEPAEETARELRAPFTIGRVSKKIGWLVFRLTSIYLSLMDPK